MAGIICLDFDDTIILDNLSRQTLRRFARPGWAELEADYHRGEMTVEQYNMRALELIPNEVTREDLKNFALEVAQPREGIVELVDWAHWNGWVATVVSNGLDVYVEAVLDKLGLDRVSRHAGRTRFEYHWQVRYLSPRGIELQEGFKTSYAAAFKNSGDFVAYVGDGASDVEAARMASAVFACSTLWERLRDEHPRIYHFETFHDVREVLEREGERWLESSSSTTAGTD